jgi:hypothetical protein
LLALYLVWGVFYTLRDQHEKLIIQQRGDSHSQRADNLAPFLVVPNPQQRVQQFFARCFCTQPLENSAHLILARFYLPASFGQLQQLVA